MQLSDIRQRLSEKDLEVIDGSVLRRMVLNHYIKHFDNLVGVLEKLMHNQNTSLTDWENFEKVLESAKELKL
jgi:hypothetical protein